MSVPSVMYKALKTIADMDVPSSLRKKATLMQTQDVLRDAILEAQLALDAVNAILADESKLKYGLLEPVAGEPSEGEQAHGSGPQASGFF